MPTQTPSTFTVGQAVDVKYEETIQHEGYYRIVIAPTAMANDEQTFEMAKTVLADQIPDPVDNTLKVMQTATVTMPTTTCDSCTLQFIQFMKQTNGTFTPYYSCADVRIVAADGTVPDAGPATGTPDAGPGDSPDAGPDDPGAGGDDDGTAEPPGLGCEAVPGGPSGHGAAAAILLGAGIGLVVLARLRRRPAPSPRRRD